MRSKIARDLLYFIVLFSMLTMEIRQSTLVGGIQQHESSTQYARHTSLVE